MTDDVKITQYDILNELARRDFKYFIKQTHKGYFFSKFSIEVCNALNQFLIDVGQGRRPILVIQAPPQHGKSELASRRFPAFAFGKNPEFRIAECSYSSDLATSMNRDVQRIMTEPEYAAIFPHSTLNNKRVSLLTNPALRNNERFDIVGHRGYYVSTGVGGPLTGKSVDIGIIDDPFKNMKEARSETIIESVISWYNTVFLTRLSQKSGQLIMATRWTVEDLLGYIIEKNKDTGRLKVLSFPAINGQGEALVPELHSFDKLMETKQSLTEFEWSALYQQEPQIIGGNIIKDEWWRFYPTSDVKYRYMFMVGDTAQKTKEANDFTAITFWGVTMQDELYLLDMIHGKWEAPDLEVQTVAFWKKWEKGIGGIKPRALYIEDKASGTGLIQTLKRKFLIPIVPIERITDKLTRVLDASVHIENGRVYLPINRDTDISRKVMAEAGAFSADMKHKHDDIVDTVCDAVDIAFRKPPMSINPNWTQYFRTNEW